MTDYTKYNKQIGTKFLHSEMEGFGRLNWEWGSLVKLVKKCIVDGSNERTISGITMDTSTKVVSVVVEDVSHGFTVNQVVEISGADQSRYNGQHRILEVVGNTIKFVIEQNETTPATTSSTMKIKVAPLGWELSHDAIDDEGIACFKNKSTQSPCILKVMDANPGNGYNDSWARFARVCIGQELEPGTYNFTENRKVPIRHDNKNPELGNGVSGSGGVHGYGNWHYAHCRRYYWDFDDGFDRDSFPTQWYLIGNDKFFYILIQSAGMNYANPVVFCAGTYVSVNSENSNNIFLGCSVDYTRTNSHKWGNSFTAAGAPFSQIGVSYGFLFNNAFGQIQPGLCAELLALMTDSGGNNDHPQHQSYIEQIIPEIGSMFMSKYYMKDNNHHFRGRLPGIHVPYNGKNLSTMLLLNYNKQIVLPTQYWRDGESSSYNSPFVFDLVDWSEEL